MREVISTALGRSDMVILCGGLGPTEDDLTKEICAQVMGIPLVEDEHVKEALEAFVRRIGLQMTDNVYKQAMVPQEQSPSTGQETHSGKLLDSSQQQRHCAGTGDGEKREGRHPSARPSG